jgi:hypothetical protein
MADLAKLGAAAADKSPMALGSEPVVPGRLLLADGDGLAYFCAGKDGTSPYDSRSILANKVASARRASGAEGVRILLTARGSHKGHRYVIASVKPYQGQRKNSRRPANWDHLREHMEAGAPGLVSTTVEQVHDAEADDLFAKYAEGNVIYTQDKDMRMVPALHLDWQTHRIVDTRHAPWAMVQNDKLYGRKWFWMQMLHGDTADYIPGLPKYVNDKGNLAQCGEKTAETLLANFDNEPECAEFVKYLYQGYYKDDWAAAMLEQACLLWIRRSPSDWDDCLNNTYGPLRYFYPEFLAAKHELGRRIQEAEALNAQAQSE